MIRSKPKQVRKCKACGEKFIAGSNSAGKFCSRKCFCRRVDITCEHCGKVVNRMACYSKTKFCGTSCRNKARAKDLPIVTCPCGKVIRSAAFNRKRKFCSHECQHKYTRGPANALWRGNRRHYRGNDWPEQRDAARSRDGNICQACGREPAVREKPSVDHIVPYRLAKVWSKDPNNIINLMTLCRGCHATKTFIEARLLSGDVIGFICDMACKLSVDESKVVAAMRFFGVNIPIFETIDARTDHGTHVPNKVVPAKPTDAEFERMLGL